VGHEHAVGIDIGATNVKSVAMRDDGEVERSLTVPLEGSSVLEVVRSVLKRLGDHPRVGIAAPGIVRPGTRSIWWMQGRLEEVQGLDWSGALGRDVPVLNDAHAALLGEMLSGGVVSLNVVMLTLGTGVGGAAIVDGNPLRGHLGRAGHLGHICLDPSGSPDIVSTPGSLEEAIGDCTIGARSDGKYPTTMELVAHLDDDELARRVWSKSIRALACGLASLINVLDPELIIIGGGISAAGERLFVPLRAEMERVEWRPHRRAVKIVPAKLGEYAGAIGAAWSAINVAEHTQ
jgi:glucokinase